MKKMFGLILAAGSGSFVLGVSAYVIPEFVCVLLSPLVFIALVVILIVASWEGFSRRRKSSRLWPVPALVCLAFILCTYYLASPVGRGISDWRFERHLAEYSRVVDGLKNGTVSCATPCNGKVEVIEATNHPATIRGIWGARCDDNGALVLFMVDTDVPLLHEGYFFKDYGKNSDCDTRAVSPEEPYVRHIVGMWYRWSDQPGF